MTAVTAMGTLLTLALIAPPAASQQAAANPQGQAGPDLKSRAGPPMAVDAGRAVVHPGTEFDSSAVTLAMVDAGRAIFHQKGMCFACHGPQLEGTQIAPTLKAHAWRDAKNGELSAILGVVSKGVTSTLMVSYPGGISPAEARSVAAYVWSVGRGKAKP